MRRRSKFRSRGLARRRRRWHTGRLFLYIMASTALVLLLAFLSHVEALSIATISVEGAAAVSESEIKALVAEEIRGNYFKIFSKTNALIFPKRIIEKKLLVSFLTLRQADVYLDAPTAISVYVVERKPYGIWCDRAEVPSCFFIDGEGYAFSPAPDISGSIFIRFYRESKAFLGERYEREGFRELASFLDHLPDLKLTPVKVTLNAGDFRITLDNGADIVVEEKQDLSAAFVTLLSLFEKETLERELRDAKVIDLRFENKVFYRPEPA